MPDAPHLLTESMLVLHNLCNDYKAFIARQERQEPSELRRVETWVTSLPTRSAAGLRGLSSVTRSRAASVSSVSSIAITLATVCTNAESQVFKGLEEEDEKSGYSSQDRDILGKRAGGMADSRVAKSTSVSHPAKKPRLEDSKRRTKDTNPDPPGQVNEGLVWRYGGFVDSDEDEDENEDEDEDENSNFSSQANGGLVWKYGGFVDSDEDDDCEYRALLLGESTNVSLTITDGATTTIVPPRTYEPRVERPMHGIKDTNSCLPRGVHDNDDWYKKFIPTYKKWLGTRVKPWVLDNDENIAALRIIWRAVYPHIDYVIDAGCPVDYMANPRVYNWRGSFDSAAIDLFKSYFEGPEFSSKETMSKASRLLQNNRFRYAETTGETKEYRGLFQSPFILELIAGHYDAISGAIRIPEFERAFSRDQQKLVSKLKTRLRTLDADSREALEIAIKLDTMRMYPTGALALCVTAVERALGVFAPTGGAFFSGHKHTKKWIEKVQKYSDFIERKLQPGAMEDIVLKACPYMDAGTYISSISVQVLNDSDDEESTDI